MFEILVILFGVFMLYTVSRFMVRALFALFIIGACLFAPILIIIGLGWWPWILAGFIAVLLIKALRNEPQRRMI